MNSGSDASPEAIGRMDGSNDPDRSGAVGEEGGTVGGEDRDEKVELVSSPHHEKMSTQLSAVEGGLQVVIAGPAGIETNSLSDALQRFGYKTCEGWDVSRNVMGSHSKLAQAFIAHDIDAIVDETESLGYNATLDSHSSFWKEIKRRRPNAKYIFMIRDIDSLMESAHNMYWYMTPLMRFPFRILPMFDRMATVSAAVVGYGIDGKADSGWKHVLHSFNREEHDILRQQLTNYDVEARRITQQEQENTLLFDPTTMGYPQLCQFLDIPEQHCPVEELYPSLSTSSDDVIFVGYIFRGIEMLIVGFPFFLINYFVRRCYFPKPKQPNENPKVTNVKKEL